MLLLPHNYGPHPICQVPEPSREFPSPLWQIGAQDFQEATDGRQAIMRLEEVRPDLIILDLSMPGMGGYKAAAEIKRLAPGVPILLYTMHHARAEDIGVDAVVSKADGIGILAERVRFFLGSHSCSHGSPPV